VSTEVEDDEEPNVETRVVLNLVKERRSSFEKFDFEILFKFGRRHGGGRRWPMIWEANKVPPKRRIRLKKTLTGYEPQRRH